MQETFDELYDRSKHNALNGINLYKKIISKNNILLAYRAIKSNTGSKTAGTDGITINDFKIKSDDELIQEVRARLADYKPNSVRRVNISKANGGLRPLGIPTMMDRLIQQTFKQILEPICEAKFHNHSYGFRPNRSAKYAVARMQKLINGSQLHYVVDIDIKGFFDNVNHTKLLKQLFNIGIKDRRILTIISKMLKAPIAGLGVPNKGTPQGGILSPLLSNIVLNDLDQWISNQWETKNTKFPYKWRGHKHKALKKTNLKEMYIVRYADDFKILARNYAAAYKIFQAVKKYLKDHLGLDISPEKSSITNLKKKGSEFLGFTIHAKRKRKKYVAITHVSSKSKEDLISRAKALIKTIQKNPSTATVQHYNSFVMGIKNYFKSATRVNIDFNEIAYRISRTLYNRLKSVGKYGMPINPSNTYKLHHKNKIKTYKILGTYLHHIADVQTVNNMSFSQNLCDYTKEGRQKHTSLKRSITSELRKLTTSIHASQSVEYSDNRLSKYSMQKGICAVTGNFIPAEFVHCHHILPVSLGGNDEFQNLVIVSDQVHRLIHATNEQTIARYLNILKLDQKQLDKLNHYRKQCNLVEIVSVE